MDFIAITLFFIILLIALSIVWSTLKTGISPMMSSTQARQTMLAEISTDEKGTLIDLGSGWGTLVIAVAKKYPNKQVVGYEVSWFPWLVSIIFKYSMGLNNLRLYRKDFKNADLSGAATLVCYLFPGAMVALEDKLKHDMAKSITIVSNTFALPSYKPVKVIKLKDFYKTPIYVYHWHPN
ncbi:MAG: methyltransferase [Pseudoalteromonas sp.]